MTEFALLVRDFGTVLAGIHSVTYAEGCFLYVQLNVLPYPPGNGGGFPSSWKPCWARAARSASVLNLLKR